MDLDIVRTICVYTGIGGLSLFIFYLVIKQILSLKIFDALDKIKTYKILRLICVLFFIIVVTCILVNFCSAPVKKDTLIDKFFEAFGKHNYSKAREYADQLRDLPVIPENEDRVRGYLVATYCEVGDYKSAIEEILKRDRKFPPHDNRLWFDMALAVRGHRNKQGFKRAIEYVSKLKNRSGGKLLSPVWAAFPQNLAYDTRNGAYIRHYDIYGDQEYRHELNYIINKYPNASFIEFAYYALGDPEKALEKNNKSIIRDLLLYTAGYKKMRDVKVKVGFKHLIGNKDFLHVFPDEEQIIFHSPGIRPLDSDVELDARERAEIAAARVLFEEIVKKFPRSANADDAQMWLATFEFEEGDPKKAIGMLRKANRLGDKKAYTCDFETKILLTLPEEELISRLEGDSYVADPETVWYSLAQKKRRENKYDESSRIAGLATTDMEKRYENDDDYRESATNRFKYFLDTFEIISKTLSSDDPAEYKKVGNMMKNQKQDPRIAIYIYSEAIRKFPDSELRDNLMFLKILCQKDQFPEQVEKSVDVLLEEYPDSEWADDALAELVYAQSYSRGNFKGAKKALEKLLAQYPNRNACDNAANWLAYSYMTREMYEEAEQAYENIIMKFPGSRFASYAEENLREIRKTQRQDDYIDLCQFDLNYHAEEMHLGIDERIKLYNKCLKIYPKDGYSWSYLGLEYWRNGQEDLACSAWAKAISLEDHPSWMVNMSQLLCMN